MTGDVGFFLDATWPTEAAEEDARVGAKRWEDIHGMDGAPLVSVTEEDNAAEPHAADHFVVITRSPDPGGLGNAAGWTNCQTIEINTNLLGDAQATRGTVAHEMGHVLNLHHTGVPDDEPWINERSQLPRYSHMTHCHTQAELGKHKMQSDDSAALQHQYSGITFPPITANPGFEDTPYDQWWDTIGGALVTQGSGGVHFKPAANSDKLRETSNITDRGGYVRATGRFKRTTPGTAQSGYLRLQLWSRIVTYTGAYGTCTFPDGVDHDVRVNNGAWQKRHVASIEKPPAGSWIGLTTATYRLSPSDTAEDVRVVFRSSVKVSGTHANIAVDDLYVEKS